MVDLCHIRQAAECLHQVVRRTPLVYSNYFSRRCGAQVFLKLENLQRTGSFKVRGAYHKLAQLRHRLPELGVVAASAGNHAQGVAFAARQMRVPATIVMPVWASISKQLATRDYGAEVVLHGNSIAESVDLARDLAAEGRIFVHPYDDLDIIWGQGTVGLEIVTELPSVEVVVVPVGGGGLAAGVAVAVKGNNPGCKVVGVQSSACAAALAARRQGRPVTVDPGNSIADGILVRQIGEHTFPLIEKLVDDLVTADEEHITAAVLDLLERKKVLAEGAGAVPLAALLNDRIRGVHGRQVAVVVSGGNVDSHLLGRIVQQGLYRTGRILRFAVVLEDIPGALAKVLAVIASLQGNVLHIVHDRMGRNLPLGLSRVEVEVESRDRLHRRQLLEELRRHGYQLEEL